MAANQTYVDNVIARCTGILGDFRMPVCVDIIRRERPNLSRQDIEKIIKRYRQHVEFWNGDIKVIENELNQFATATGLSFDYVAQVYNDMRFVGIYKYDCITGISAWQSALNQNGIENKIQAGRSSGKCYLLVRLNQYQLATSLLNL